MESVDRFRMSILDLDEGLSEFLGSSPSMVDVCSVLADLNQIKRDLSLLYEQFADKVADAMGDVPEVVLPNGLKVEKRSASDRKAWHHRDLIGEVARRLTQMSFDPDTGERLQSTDEVVTKVLDFVQPSYWRVKELGKIGINADDYCDVSEGKQSIIVRKG